MKRSHSLLLLITMSLLMISAYQSDKKPYHAVDASASTFQQTSFTLDGVKLTLTVPSLPNQTVILPGAQDPVQTASFFNHKPLFESLTLTVIPFGKNASMEVFPAAGSNTLHQYREILMAFRRDQDGFVEEGPDAILFGEKITGIMSSVDIYLDVQAPTPVRILEWIFDGGNRLWILRYSQEIDESTASPSPSMTKEIKTAWAGVKLTSTNLDTSPGNWVEKVGSIESSPIIIESTTGDLPFPSWWDGDCDTNTYHDVSGLWAYPLGGIYRGVKACGPRPWYDGAPNVLVQFFPGSWGAYEWQCVELSMRFLYLAYGIAPYKANGNQVVTNYSGTRLVKISNGTPGFAPQPNDVISMGPDSTYGHTAVIAASNVDGVGNGAITLLEQNASSTGINHCNVVNWVVTCYTSVIGWLHDPENDLIRFYFPMIH